MSITSLSFTLVNTYAPQAVAPRPAAAPAAQPVQPASTQDNDGDSDRGREGMPGGGRNRLEQAILSALQDLGFGTGATASGTTPAQAAGSTSPAQAAATTTDATSALAASASTAAASATDAAVTAPTASVTDAASAATDAASATQAAATDSTTPADNSTAATTDTSSAAGTSIAQAVHEFAHALFQALRDGSGGQGHSAGHRHHHHHGHRGGGYGDLSQRLGALAQQYGASTTAGSDAQGSPVSTSLTITLNVQDGSATSTAPAQVVDAVSAPADASTTAATDATPAVQPGAQVDPQAAVSAATDNASASSATADTAPSSNPLLQAFTSLLHALQPQSAGATSASVADTLHTFLKSIADALKPESISHGWQAPQAGSLLNVTA